MEKKTVEKPWGSFTQFTHNESSTVKLLYVTKGEEFSLQYHHNRTEFWKVLKGSPELIIGEDKVKAKEGDEFSISPGIKHRIRASGGDVVVLEISIGDFDEEDIVRTEDKYGRV